MNNPWQLYDDLIDLIPPGTKVRDARIGNWACVTSDAGTGVAMIYRGGPRSGFAERDMVGRDLRDAASAVKSWDLELAALGVAAINSFLTAEERVSANLTPGEDERSTFERHAETRPDLRIATIGHFGDIEKYAEGRDLIVLERSPSGNDLPDPAGRPRARLHHRLRPHQQNPAPAARAVQRGQGDSRRSERALRTRGPARLRRRDWGIVGDRSRSRPTGHRARRRDG